MASSCSEKEKNMSIAKFITRKPVLICMILLVAALFLIPAEVLAQELDATAVGSTGPFEAFLTRAADMFSYTRNALFFIAAFAFIGYAWNAIQEGKIDWTKLLYLVVALVLLGVAGYIVNYIANPNKGNTETRFEGLKNSSGWDE
jgi:type IV secretory pathway VirB2 component (pilin)